MKEYSIDYTTIKTIQYIPNKDNPNEIISKYYLYLQVEKPDTSLMFYVLKNIKKDCYLSYDITFVRNNNY